MNNRMNKNGFTLADALIALVIIGIIGLIVVPMLFSNAQERRAITTFKKAVNTLNTAVEMNLAQEGFDFSAISSSTEPAANNIFDSESNGLDRSVWGIIASKTKVDMSATTNRSIRIPGACNENGIYQIFFSDGTAMCYRNWTTIDGQPRGIRALIDTNGVKGPNVQSACNDDNCRSGKAIRDQFLVTLMDSSVHPGGVTKRKNGVLTTTSSKESNAAVWALSQ